MTKSKQPGPAPFDLLGPTQEEVNRNLRVPEKTETRQPEPASPAPAPPPERAIVPGRPRAPKPDAVRSTPPASSTARRRPLISFDDECVHLTLTSFRAAIVVFVILVGLLGIYEWGRTNGRESGYGEGHRAGRASFQADAASEIEAARHRPPASHLVEGLLEANAGSVAPDNPGSGSAPVWVQGHTYVVAQEFAPNAESDAEEAKAFLQSKGIDTATIKLDTGWFQLITTQGFDRSDSVQRDLADRLLARVHQAGIAYYADGGGYKLEGYLKTMRNQSW